MRLASMAKIPRIIWQTHRFKEEQLPPYISACTESWALLNPDFEYRYVSEEETYAQISSMDNGRFENIFKYKYMSKVTRADIWRLLILREHGGVYVDCDMVCTKPILEFINLRKEFAIDTVDIQFMNSSEYVANYFGNTTLHFGAMNGIIASSPKNIIIESCCEALESLCAKAIISGQIIGAEITGPTMLTHCLNRLLNENKHLEQMFQPAGHPLFSGSVVDLNGAFMWNDRVNKLTFNMIGNMFDKFIDAEDQSAMPTGGDAPSAEESETAMYRGFERVGIKFTKKDSHYS